MSERQQGILALTRAVNQAAGLLDEITADDLGKATPCTDWDVRALANHLLATTRVFVTMMQGVPPGWHREDGDGPYGDEMRTRGNVLINLWREQPADEAAQDADWQAAEVAVHTWDLATALGRPTADLDQAVAQRALVTMDRVLGPERKGRAFQNALAAPEGSDAYAHLAAYAGRRVSAD